MQAEPFSVLDEQLAEVGGPLAIRARALLAWRLGDLQSARSLLEGLAEHKRPRNDIFYWLACVCRDQGDTAAARLAVDRFLEKASKRTEYRVAAEALRAELPA